MTNKTYGPQTLAWSELKEKAVSLSTTSIASMFSDDSARGEKFSRESAGIFFDFSRQHLDSEALESLVTLAEQTNDKEVIERIL